MGRLLIPLRRTPRVLTFVVFNFSHISFFFRAPTLQSLPKLLSRRVLRIAAVCTDEVLSGINPPSQSGIEPESSDSLAFVLSTRPPRLPYLVFWKRKIHLSEKPFSQLDGADPPPK